MAAEHTLELLRAMRAEVQEFREESRKNFASVFHRLNVVEATLANLKADVAILLSSVPVMNERLDALEARVAALEAGR
jgi:polyhydroxyalkanoate synthesis regulator phasin